MAHEVLWTKIILEEFVKEALLSKDEEWIMRTRCAGWTVRQQADALCMSERNVHKIIARLKLKYDAVQKYSPLLPPRKRSAQETYMDTN